MTSNTGLATVLRVNEWEKDGKPRWYVDLDDSGEKVESVSFSPTAAELKVGEALPDGWVLEQPKEPGWKPMLKPPKPSKQFGGKGRSPEQFAQEQVSIRASVALKAAVDYANGRTLVPRETLIIADIFDTWLTDKTSGTASSGEGRAVPDPSPSQQLNSNRSTGDTGNTPQAGPPTATEGAGAGDDERRGSVQSPAPCPHELWEDVPNRKELLRCISCGVGKRKLTV